MNKVLVRELYRNIDKYIDKEVEVSGWVKTIRDSKTFGFIELNDGSFFKNVQIVIDDKLKNFDEVCKYTISSSIKVVGTVVKTENAKPYFKATKTPESDFYFDLQWNFNHFEMSNWYIEKI